MNHHHQGRSRWTAAILALVLSLGSLPASAGMLATVQPPVMDITGRVAARGIPGASAIAQVGTFLTGSPCGSPIPSKFAWSIQPGAVLDPKRVLVGARSNFGAPRPDGTTLEGSILSIDPSGPDSLLVGPWFASSGDQDSALDGRVRMVSANSPAWLNRVNNPGAATGMYAGVSNPLGLSNNNAFGRLWPANSPFGQSSPGSSSILDPDGRPLKGPPNARIGGVYLGRLTDRDQVTTPPQPQVVTGALNRGAVGTAFLGPSPDGTCKAVFAVVTADGAIVQEHTLKGLDGLAPAGTVRPLIGRGSGLDLQNVEPRLGVLMNPYAPAPAVLQLFISEPFDNTIAVLDLVVYGTPPNQVFAPAAGPVRRLSSDALNQPVDLAPAAIEQDSTVWASNTTLDQRSDLYVANRGNNTIVRMRQDGTVVAIGRVRVKDLLGSGFDVSLFRLNGIATSGDGTKLYVTFTSIVGGVLELPAFT